MIFIARTLFVICTFTLLLTACQKNEPAPAPNESVQPDTATQSTSPASPIDPATLVIDSPFLAHEVAMYRALVVHMFVNTYPNLTDDQKHCLTHIEGNPNYLEVLKPFFMNTLSTDEITEADAFYASNAGGKFSHITQRMAGADLPPIEPPTQDERIRIFKTLDKPFGTTTINMSDERKATLLQPIINKEAVRCKII